jgi:hypothetical protein
MGLAIFTSCTFRWSAMGSSTDLMTVSKRRLTKKPLNNIRIKMSKQTKMPTSEDIPFESLLDLVNLLCDTQVKNLRGRHAIM